MYKLIVSDLDGTLLNNQGAVSQKNKEAIKNAMDKNVKIVLASGRGLASTKAFSLECGINDYLISGNGSLLYDISKDETIYNNCIPTKKVLEIIDICEQNSIFYSISTTNSMLTKSINYNILGYYYENINKPDNLKTNINVVDDLYDYVKNFNIDKYFKITICDSDKIVFSRVIDTLRKIKDIEVLDVAHMSTKRIKNGTDDVKIEYYYTEITNIDVNKWNAIQILMDRLGVSKEEVIAIGDNVNDKQMLENAGLGVAMGNSAGYIKEFANEVALDNNSDGVANIIEKYI